MGLFSKTQTITVGLSDSKYLVEKVETQPISKNEVDLIVRPGTVAVVGNMTFKGRNTPYPVTKEHFVTAKKETCQIYLYPDKMFDSIQISFFGGQHQLCISSLKKAKGKFLSWAMRLSKSAIIQTLSIISKNQSLVTI